jgi:hypothetical protein
MLVKKKEEKGKANSSEVFLLCQRQGCQEFYKCGSRLRQEMVP